uniref:Uncharacterized protein n=1 Tax=Arundo donax TaxID=35708 RepID=A0A0A8YXX0_ARUDO
MAWRGVGRGPEATATTTVAATGAAAVGVEA